jgi:predicted RND superfamily exporter protein
MLFGLMPLVGIQLNLANFFAIPMLIGLGIDSAIHILHRWREAPDQLASTVRAVAFTALTTAIGFGALMFAQHRGMRSLGIAMGVGSLTCMYVACVVLPLMLRSIRRNDTQTNSGSTPGGSA